MKNIILILLAISLLSFIDGVKSPLPSTIATTQRIKYPGFKSDTLTTDSVKFCLVDGTKELGCDFPEEMRVKFILDPKDSILTERSNDGRDILVNIFSIKNITEISANNVNYTKYSMTSRLFDYKDNIYVIQKINKVDYMVMYCITNTETYKVSFF